MLIGYLTLLAAFALTALPLIAVLPASPPIVDGTDGARRPSLIPWRISFTVTIARSSPKEQPV